ncbi:MAG: flavin reductase [Phycisphaerae bacterium]|nr:flavin reductase [Gemmatimonadaceae bacterium]
MSEPSTNPMRRALRAMTHGVYVLSVSHAQRDEYIVVALAMQCSVEPPRVAFSVSNSSRILGVLRAAGGGVLSVLDASQRVAVRRYGTPGGVRNASSEVSRSEHGHPIAPEGAFWMQLQVHTEIAAGDHVLFVADVLQAGTNSDAFDPLTLAASKFPYAG